MRRFPRSAFRSPTSPAGPRSIRPPGNWLACPRPIRWAWTATSSYAQGSAALGGFSIQVLPSPLASRTVTVYWTPPAANTDGSALTDLAGYRIYYQRFDFGNWGTQQILTVADPNATSSVLQGLQPGTYTLCVTAYNAANVESAPTFYASSFVL
jgi:hypothetical protein